MIFNIPETGITVDMVNAAIRNYMCDRTYGLEPQYAIFHPEDKYKFERSLCEYMYSFIRYNPSSEKMGLIDTVTEYRSVKLISSYDIKRGQFILCGA